MDKEFNVYDEVWVMDNCAPRKMIVFAVIRSMNFMKNGEELSYDLVRSKIGANIGLNKPIRRPPHMIFLSRKELVLSLLEEGKQEC